jgi:hypothetical protein
MNQAASNIRLSKGPRRPKMAESGRTTRAAEAAAHEHEGLRAAIVPGLFNLDEAAAYLSMSPWTIRDLEAAGVLPRVRVSLPRGGELRKLLFDKADLDRLIAGWKETAA